jgi:hypothetical protein
MQAAPFSRGENPLAFLWIFGILLGVIFGSLSLSLADSLSVPASHSPDEERSRREQYFEAYQQGMPRDSLYFLLAEDALRSLAYDTAMAFNLSVSTPISGAFRDSLLFQRYRLYQISGLVEDAERLKDSLPQSLSRSALAADINYSASTLSPEQAAMRSLSLRSRMRPDWELRFLSGYVGEQQTEAVNYPSGLRIPGLESEGWQAKTQGRLGFSLPFESVSSASSAFPLRLGLGYAVTKSYYKDSLDYRAEFQLKAERILKGLSGGISTEMGRVAGIGAVAAWKADLTYLAMGEGGFWLGNLGFESEWEQFTETFREKRYDAAWISLFKQWGLGKVSLQGAFSASLLQFDPLRISGLNHVMFVSDVSQTRPVHFRDATFSDSLPKNSIASYSLYVGALDSVPWQIPQNTISLRPSLGFSAPLGWGAISEWTGSYSFTLYPERYSWWESQGSQESELGVGDTVEFRGYALNQVDGQYYQAAIDQRSGGFDEIYATAPLREQRLLRQDHRFSLDMVLKRPLGFLGVLALTSRMERTYSNLSGIAPLWIPAWDYGVGLRWTQTGRWH